MSISSYRVWIMALSAIIISLAAIAMSTYSMTKDIQASPAVTATERYLNEKFTWYPGEVIDVQGNLYAYMGYEGAATSYYGERYILRIAKWQNAWLELTYAMIDRDFRYRDPYYLILSPYKLQVIFIGNSGLEATFLES